MEFGKYLDIPYEPIYFFEEGISDDDYRKNRQTPVFKAYAVDAEGEQYEVGEVDFGGDILFPKQELFDAIKIDDNGIFAYDVLQKDIADLTAKYGDLGYAYAKFFLILQP